MKSGGRSMSNNPIQPLSPKRQPWVMAQVPGREKARAETHRLRGPSPANSSPSLQTVQQELMLRERIENRTAIRLEKLHEAIGVDRLNRRLQRQRSLGSDAGEIVRALKERKELKKSLSMGRNPRVCA